MRPLTGGVADAAGAEVDDRRQFSVGVVSRLPAATSLWNHFGGNG